VDTENKTDLDPNIEQLIEQIVSQKMDAKFSDIQKQLTDIQSKQNDLAQGIVADRVTLFVFSGDFDKLFSAFIIATGAAAMGSEVSMFFTFWALTAIKKKTIYTGKGVKEKMVAMMMPSGPTTVGTSKMNMMGMGPIMFKAMMKDRKTSTLPELIDLAKEMGVKIIACQMSMEIMGMTPEEMIDDIDYGGVAAYLGDAVDSKVTLYI